VPTDQTSTQSSTEDAAFAAWVAAVAELAAAETKVPWLLGDALLQGEAFGVERAYDAAAEATGRSRQNLKDVAWVARSVPEETRDYRLPWRTHRLVAKHQPGRQRFWLTQALDFDMTSTELQQAMHVAGEANAPPEPWRRPDMTTDHRCPSCGYEWSGACSPPRRMEAA
jgi:hypothetical protein